MTGVNRYRGTDYPEQSTLFLEFHGSEAGVEEKSALFGTIAAANRRIRLGHPGAEQALACPPQGLFSAIVVPARRRSSLLLNCIGCCVAARLNVFV
jgi:hypothetical protein